MKKTRRTTQLGDVVRQELSTILMRDLRDPEIGFVTIVDVEVSTDMRLARVFISVLGDEAKKKTAVTALRKASSRIRYMLAQRVNMRNIPELDFRLDTTADYAEGIERTLREIKAEDEKKEKNEE